jgi:hypothetical protein
MAISIGPPRALAGLRSHWHATTDSYYRHSHLFREAIEREAKSKLGPLWRIAFPFVTGVGWRAWARARKRASYACFVERYEELVDLLCWAAKDGVVMARDARYAELRRWMQPNYRKLRRQLRIHLEPWEGPFDPFEALFASECIETVINDVSGIMYVTQTRTALEAYAAQLESTDQVR